MDLVLMTKGIGKAGGKGPNKSSFLNSVSHQCTERVKTSEYRGVFDIVRERFFHKNPCGENAFRRTPANKLFEKQTETVLNP